MNWNGVYWDFTAARLSVRNFIDSSHNLEPLLKTQLQLKSQLSFGDQSIESFLPSHLAICPAGNAVLLDGQNGYFQLFDPKGLPLGLFGGGLGSDPGQFCRPSVVVFARNQQMPDIIVCDTGNTRIQVFTFTGSLAQAFGSKGEAAGQFLRPRGVAIDHDGNIVVCDSRRHDIQIFTLQGEFLRRYNVENGPFDVAFVRDCYFISHPEQSLVNVYDLEGKLKRTLDSKKRLKLPCTLALDVLGFCIVADPTSRTVQIYDPAGSFEKELSLPKREIPNCCCLDPFGDLVVLNGRTGTVYMFGE